MRPRLNPLLVAGLCGVLLVAPSAQVERGPLARLIRAPQLVMPGVVDSNVPMTWELVDGQWRLFAFTSWGGTPTRVSGSALDHMQPAGPVAFVPHPGDGLWIESVIRDDTGTWYGYYHHETPADVCGRRDRFSLRIGAAKSTDRGATWQDLGIILDAAPDSFACASSNAFVMGGVGDVSAMLTADRTDVFLFFTQYSKRPSEQGVAVARLAWADRDAPAGRVTIWVNGAWLPPRPASGSDAEGSASWAYPAGTPLVPVTKPWHDGDVAADAFWGPSVHWNAYLEQYVMLLNRAKDELFNNDGIYVSFARTLRDPRAWSTPRKIMDAGEWYPQVAGLEPVTGSDKQAGRRARFLLMGRSDYYIDFFPY